MRFNSNFNFIDIIIRVANGQINDTDSDIFSVFSFLFYVFYFYF